MCFWLTSFLYHTFYSECVGLFAAHLSNHWRYFHNLPVFYLFACAFFSCGVFCPSQPPYWSTMWCETTTTVRVMTRNRTALWLLREFRPQFPDCRHTRGRDQKRFYQLLCSWSDWLHLLWHRKWRRSRFTSVWRKRPHNNLKTLQCATITLVYRQRDRKWNCSVKLWTCCFPVRCHWAGSPVGLVGAGCSTANVSRTCCWSTCNVVEETWFIHDDTCVVIKACLATKLLHI